MDIKTFGVIGSGQMGSGIAQVAALSGMNVVMNDISDELIEKGLQAIRRNLDRSVEKEIISEAEKTACIKRIRPSADFKDMSFIDFVVEAENGSQKEIAKMGFVHRIDSERCKGCGLCVMVCPKDVLALSDKLNAKGYHTATQAHPENCVHCSLCCRMCPDVAITIEPVDDGKDDE